MTYLLFGFIVAMCLYGTGLLTIGNRAEYVLVRTLCQAGAGVLGLVLLARAHPLLAAAALFCAAVSIHTGLKTTGVVK